MAKGVVADSSIDTVRSNHSGSSAPAHSTHFSRTSVLASVVPMFRRPVDNIHKAPLLTLKLSSESFLDTTVTDDVTEQPLYTVKTVGPTTTIKRADPWDGDTKTAEIRWSRIIPHKGKNVSDGVQIHMRGVRWQGSETFLKRGTLSSERKFYIPKYAESLKWKRQGSTYWCTTAAVKGPIATLERVGEPPTPQFQIFETLYDKNDARPMLVHHGVSTLLLDYMLVTALFLVTDPQAWTQSQTIDIINQTGDATDHLGLATPKSTAANFSTSNQQWRKIQYGEPIYPNRFSTSSHSSRSSSSEALTPTSISTEQQMAKVTFGHPLYQPGRPSSPDPSISESESVSDRIYFSPLTTRSHSPASESIFSPVSRSAAPSHTYLDPSFYNSDDENVPPVPPIPPHFNITNSEANHSSQSRPSSAHSTGSSSARRLPDVPVLFPVHPLIPRPRSTPPRPRTASSINHFDQAASGPSVPRIDTVSNPSVTPRRPRQLPRPPQVTTTASHGGGQPPSGRVRTRSASQSRAMHESEKWRPYIGYGQRSLPTPPTSSSQGDAGAAPLHLRRLVSEDGRYVVYKEMNDNLGDWGGSAEQAVAYDMPPPAYNSINFSPRGSPMQDPASPLS